MRWISAAMAFATLTTCLAAPAHADSGWITVGSQDSGTWSTYTITFSAPLTQAWVSIQGFESPLYQFDGYYDGPDLDYYGGCIPGSQCEADIYNSRGFIRRASWSSTQVSFSTYVPRSYFSCSSAPGRPTNYGALCGEIFGSGGILLDYESNSAAEFSVTQLAGGIVPEPASWALMILGFVLVGTARRRRYFNRAA